MNTVVLTFPGHFFQTALCLQSLLRHYPEYSNNITVIADDVQCKPWSDYIDDLSIYLGPGYKIVPVSSISKIRDCVAGWWRQQLIKLTLDRILPGDQWFVVDGDVIFRSRCNVAQCVPVTRRYDADSRWSKMCVNYVQNLLGTEFGIMHDQTDAVITSPVPFRHLDSNLLCDLRRYVELRFGGDFVDLHMRWFDDQTIVADIDPPDRWVMSEWELIECYRRMVRAEIWPYKDIGSGYQITDELDSADPAQEIFVHSYLRDSSIGMHWFHEQGVSIPDLIWQKSLAWYEEREIRRLT